MKLDASSLVTASLLCIVLAASATTRYVDLSSAAPAAPYTNWLSAATNIQDAVDVAVAGDDIVVTNGVYQAGAREAYGTSNRVAVTRAVMLRSVNGPAVTSIVGSGPNGSNAVRCAYLTNGAVLEGFTLANGATSFSGEFLASASGGGVCCESSSALVTNCVLAGNWACLDGGGAYGGTLNNCIVYCNSAPDGPDYSGSTFSHSCTTPLRAGPGNIASEPLFVNANGWSHLRLQTNSPCINAGNDACAPGLTDLDGNPRIVGGRVDVGAYEFQGTGLSGFTAWLRQYGLRIDGSADYADTDHDGHNNWQEWCCQTDPTNAFGETRPTSGPLGQHAQ